MLPQRKKRRESYIENSGTGTGSLNCIHLSSHAFDVSFHLSKEIVAAALINGDVEFHSLLPLQQILDQQLVDPAHGKCQSNLNQLDEEDAKIDGEDIEYLNKTGYLKRVEDESEKEDDYPYENSRKHLGRLTKKLATYRVHKKSCRRVSFLNKTDCFVTASADKHCKMVNIESGDVVWNSKKHGDGVSSMETLDSNVFFSGDDEGMVAAWDTRLSSAPIMKFQEHYTGIEGICYRGKVSEANLDNLHLLAIGGDQLAVFDLRMKKLFALSDHLDVDLTDLTVVKHGRKVLCSSEKSVLSLFTWGDFGDMNDRITSLPCSVSCMVKYNENVVLSGGSDGLIRAVQLLPNNIAGIIGRHGSKREGFVERIAMNFDKSLIASVAHDNLIRIHSTTGLRELVQRMNKKGCNSIMEKNCISTKNFFSDL